MRRPSPGFSLALAGLVLGLAAGGCAGDPPTLNGQQSNAVSADSGANGAAFPEQQSGSKTETAGFNPFSPTASVESGARQIIQNPTKAEIMQIGQLPDMALGRADAPVTIIKYASLTCPHCRAFHKTAFPVLKREYIDTGKVRFIIREFPIGKTSGNATIALRCARPEKYFELYGKYLEQQPTWVSQEVRLEPIFAVAQQVGMTRSEFDACLKNQGMIEALKWVKDRGRTLGIIGTPNFFVEGKLVKSVLSIEDIRALVDPLVGAGSATAQAAPSR